MGETLGIGSDTFTPVLRWGQVRRFDARMKTEGSRGRRLWDIVRDMVSLSVGMDANEIAHLFLECVRGQEATIGGKKRPILSIEDVDDYLDEHMGEIEQIVAALISLGLECYPMVADEEEPGK